MRQRQDRITKNSLGKKLILKDFFCKLGEQIFGQKTSVSNNVKYSVFSFIFVKIRLYYIIENFDSDLFLYTRNLKN